MSTVRLAHRSSLQLSLPVIELSPPDPSGAISLLCCRLQEKSLKGQRHFPGVTILISSERLNVWLLRGFFFLSFKEKAVLYLLLSVVPDKNRSTRSVCLIIAVLKETRNIQNDTRVRQNFIFQLKVNTFVILCFSMILLKRS